MKKYISLLILCFGFLFTSCEEVVEVDLDTAPAKLVIDANLYYDAANPNKPQVIKLSKTVGFYAADYDPVLDGKIWIEDELGNAYEFVDLQQNGSYSNLAFTMQLNTRYQLFVITEGQTYVSEANFFNTPEIVRVDQKDNGGLFGESYEFKIWFQDNPDQENYYQLIDALDNKIKFGLQNDIFSNGNLMNFIIIDSDSDSDTEEKIKPGESFDIYFSEVSKAYYLYMEKILSTSQNAGNPFAPPMGEIRGNIINQTDSENYPLGFFSLQNTIHKVITVE
ncbi:DUF4249 domain-containing protein [Flavobacterium agricola]|uniref:DUF4249 domain-containing protein n=1 Tax=Flavobacterium agricola TaxID=2870839 RepID=A0ABY6LYW7_9FLAO|nr:DUF4249 domain-containing protein [Flavobacterium agricola]UYW01518.1 DUF4249 domain-containing protein [Flavobacterium agricola]